MADPPANTYDKDGQLVPNRPATLGELMGLVRKIEPIEAELRRLMSGRDEREATTEQERQKREDAEEKARALDAEREAEEDERSLSTYAKGRIADLEDERRVYRARLQATAHMLGHVHCCIDETLKRHQENPACTD